MVIFKDKYDMILCKGEIMVYHTQNHLEINLEKAKQSIEGGCAIVYHVSSYAAKIYKFAEPHLQLSPRLFQLLHELPLVATNLPIDFLYQNDDTRKGYISKWINENNQPLITMQMEKFLTNYHCLEQDSITLGENGILINDEKKENLSFGSQIVWNDCDLFRIINQNCKRSNQSILSYLFYDILKREILTETKKTNDISSYQQAKRKLIKLFSMRTTPKTKSQYLSKKLSHYPHISSYLLGK